MLPNPQGNCEQTSDNPFASEISLGCIQTSLTSFFNHNCDNNVDQVYLDGPKVILYAAKPIKKYEEVYINKKCITI